MNNYVPTQDTPQAFGGSIWGASLEAPIYVAANSIAEVLEALKVAALAAQEAEKGDYRAARGALAHLKDKEPPEDTIRRIRGG
jgi:hypothetical protein